MAWTQTDVDKLKAALATGVKDVTYSDGSRAVYRSLDEMRQVLSMMQAEVAGAAVARTKAVRVNSRSGF